MPAVHDRDLAPAAGLTPVVSGWRVDAAHARLYAARSLPAGWYEVRLRAVDGSAGRKRVELVFPAADRPAAREAFAWTDRCAERFVVNLPRPATGVRVDVWDAVGTLSLAGFRVRRLSAAAAVVRSARAKLHLLRTHRCLGPAAGRGLKLLARGDWRRFRAEAARRPGRRPQHVAVGRSGEWGVGSGEGNPNSGRIGFFLPTPHSPLPTPAGRRRARAGRVRPRRRRAAAPPAGPRPRPAARPPGRRVRPDLLPGRFPPAATARGWSSARRSGCRTSPPAGGTPC